jgi:hypothetical protein
MAEYIETTYQPPQSYQDAHKGADEAGDIRYLHASAAVIRIGGVPVVAIENLNISQQINRSPIYVVGSIAPIGFDVQGVSVNVSGQMVQLANMSLNQSSFYAASEAEVIANINRVFNIDIVMMDYSKEDPADIPTEPFLTVQNCQNTGSNIVVNPNTNLKDSFTAVGTFMIRDWDTLQDFNKIAA